MSAWPSTLKLLAAKTIGVLIALDPKISVGQNDARRTNNKYNNIDDVGNITNNKYDNIDYIGNITNNK